MIPTGLTALPGTGRESQAVVKYVVVYQFGNECGGARWGAALADP